MGYILREKRDIPSKPHLRTILMLKEASLHMHQIPLLTKGGERKEGLLSPFRSPLANKVPHPGSSPKEENRMEYDNG